MVIGSHGLDCTKTQFRISTVPRVLTSVIEVTPKSDKLFVLLIIYIVRYNIWFTHIPPCSLHCLFVCEKNQGCCGN